MAVMCGVADLAAAREASYRLCLALLVAMKVAIQRGPQGTQQQSVARAAALAATSPQAGCRQRRCRRRGWRAVVPSMLAGFGHRRTNKACLRFKKSALPKPRSVSPQ